MSIISNKSKGLQKGINGVYSGSIGCIVFQKNGRVRINSIIRKLKTKKKNETY